MTKTKKAKRNVAKNHKRHAPVKRMKLAAKKENPAAKRKQKSPKKRKARVNNIPLASNSKPDKNPVFLFL
jgi:hypothetical protein